MLEFFVTKGQELKRRDQNVVSADTTDLKAQFDLTSDFTGTITVWWRRSDKPGSTWTSTLSGNQCTIPAEALSAATDNVMYGQYDHFIFVSISDTGRTTSSECEIRVNKSAFSTNATPGTGGSPTAYEELVEQFDELKADNQTFKDDMTQQQTEFESTVTENVDNIRYVVETETAPPIIDEASGAEITLDDSAYRQVRDLQLYGYSKQIQTTGAQILDASKIPASLNGITTTIDDDGYIVLNGTSTNIVFLPIPVSLGSGTQVYVSAGNPTADSNVFVRLSAASGEIIAGDLSLTIANATDAWTISKAATQFIIRVSMGVTLTNFRLRPMLSLGSSPLPWEPYSGGVASPSPDWPQPIHSVADEVNLLNENLFEYTAGDEFKFIHVQTDAKSVTASSNISRQPGGSAYIYLASGNISSTDGVSTSNNGVYSGRNVTVKPSDGYVTILYTLNNKILVDFSDYCVMVNAGDVALPWRPYGHNVMVESQGEQLIDLPKNFASSYGGISLKGLSDGSFLYIGTASERDINIWMAGGWASTDSVVNLRSGEYSAPKSEALFYNDSTFLNENDIITVPDGGMDITGIRAPSAVTGTNYNKIIYPMLNRGSTPLPWQPYVAPSSALITLTDSLRGIPVDSGGNYTDESGQQWIADYIYRRQTDGKWMLWRNCGEAEYDGSEDEAWTLSSNLAGRYITSIENATTYANALSDNFINIKTSDWEKLGGFVIEDLAGHSYFNTQISTLEAWKAWLSANPQNVVYQLATPTIEELPEDVQAELNGLYTYNLHTDMWNNDGAYMNLKYVVDTKTWINNKIAGLSTAMLNQN